MLFEILHFHYSGKFLTSNRCYTTFSLYAQAFPEGQHYYSISYECLYDRYATCFRICCMRSTFHFHSHRPFAISPHTSFPYPPRFFITIAVFTVHEYATASRGQWKTPTQMHNNSRPTCICTYVDQSQTYKAPLSSARHPCNVNTNKHTTTAAMLICALRRVHMYSPMYVCKFMPTLTLPSGRAWNPNIQSGQFQCNNYCEIVSMPFMHFYFIIALTLRPLHALHPLPPALTLCPLPDLFSNKH